MIGLTTVLVTGTTDAIEDIGVTEGTIGTTMSMTGVCTKDMLEEVVTIETMREGMMMGTTVVVKMQITTMIGIEEITDGE